ncbi:MAG: NAD(P)/FAD-dependent oxidoreductase [Cyclobacteriaceae bacterium]|nr:NAD(P)/FAD-dependent oxidoreductase [Cyclobacteriaceae bacterium SS2]
MKNIVIIGNGIAGITAARHIRKQSNDHIVVISGETDHFFSRTALMYIYMGHMKYEHTKPYEDWFWEKNKIELVKGWVKTIDFENKTLHLDTDTVSYHQLIIATGSRSNKFGWPGQDLKGVQGLYSYQDLESMEATTQDIDHAVVVGGGLIGIEMVEMLHSRHIPVTFLVREDSFWDIVLPPEESEMINRHIQEYGIDLKLGTELDQILDDGTGKVKGVKTKSGDLINCQFVGLTVGVSPNIGFLREAQLEMDKGILVNEYLETSIPDVYAIGDCAQLREPLPHRKPIEAIWYAGRMMGETIAQTILGNKTAYKPGVWFNSAKFFDIEYQVYGQVNTRLKGDESSIYWEDDSGKKSVRIVFNKDTGIVLGMNTLGVRFRHEVWDRWISSEEKIGNVITNLRKSLFDPEFFKEVDIAIQEKFNQELGHNVPVRKKSFLEKILS